MANINIVTGGEFEEAIKDLHLNGQRKYSGVVDDYFDHPYFEIWEVSNSDFNKISEYCDENQILARSAKGRNRGTAYDFLTIHNNPIIAWKENLTTESFDCLTDYFQTLGVKDPVDMIDYSFYLAKTNGMDIVKFWQTFEGN